MDECNKVHSIPENDKENNGKGKQMSVRKIISDYRERTTFHGFRYFILGGSFIRQLIWLGLILCSFAYFTFNGIRLFINFLNLPTMTKNEIITKQMMLFPAITVCNYNPIKQSKLQQHITTRIANIVWILTKYIKCMAIVWMKMESLLAASGEESLAAEKISGQPHKVWGSAIHLTQVKITL
ncbi:amiloride-sensitive sodium channel subunit alpha-like [Paramuricea clavata]|uniref:Amiloride-sensitive sodium channel subunit alpha-like n=1 Tax=Paramuricea clavata TaxID=317549 RepID=A0A6S7G3U9_PARCT|nr:amiloride-sensitive sodium channel subunit alpha-like [Paramuricea clavata]